ncbi:metal ABC transporter ATP-binding protein [Salipaludibacillus aurantiacus]|uniref:Iron/zinc/copper transport system ATP-binding protein n=1 Tax=Salipaludibacillus aurantiacus TaxID=1601833 RepID=A0A1H9RAB8_9BACI|nr:metal ABC transporter ATP-binding protein [Salipaludibacillus aurantiacus]SER69598.1 iron/zinc/copper transport system ATP-binding protein [Salipaludibacillus aurantiacus]
MADERSIKVDRLSVHYHGQTAIRDITFTVSKGMIVGVIGPNGAGKSTLMKAMLGLEKSKGEVLFFGKKINAIRKQVAYVPQRNSIDWDFPVRVEDVVLMGRFMHIPWYKKTSREDRSRAREALEKVGMQEYSNRQIGELSGGQQQRVFIARALAQDADLFFLDEPFVGIDVESEKIIVELLHQLSKEEKTIFIIHHDLSKVEKYFDELVLLNQTLIHAGNVKEVYKPDFLKEAYRGSAAVINEGNEMVVVGP